MRGRTQRHSAAWSRRPSSTSTPALAEGSGGLCPPGRADYLVAQARAGNPEPGGDGSAEIQVFRLTQKTAELDRDLLRAIDKAIPFPLLFELIHGDLIKLAAAWKRRSEAERTRWVIGDYFETEWLPGETPRVSLPVATNLDALYERLLGPLVERQVSGAGSGAEKDVAEAPEGYADPNAR
jgi:hypothetical protein